MGKVSSPIICGGVMDRFITDDHVGAHEDVYEEGVERVSHTAALEVVDLSPASTTAIAAGWIAYTAPGYAQVSLYRHGSPTITTAPLPYQTGDRKWIARAGYDPDCSVVAGATSCGWFSWSDAWNEVNWIAVGDNGALSSAWYTAGWDGSGDIGTVVDQSGSHTRQLRAYISADRSTVLARLFEGSTQVGGPLTLRTMQTNFEAYQTAVAWSPRHARWLVVWAENYVAGDGIWAGKVHSRWVAFDGTLQTSAQNLMYCETDQTTAHCSNPGGGSAPVALSAAPPVTSKPDGGAGKPDAGPDGGGTRRNDHCFCKGIFLAASYHYLTWPGDTDAFRVHQYGYQARLSGDGYRQALYSNGTDMYPGCSTWCPLDRIPPLQLAGGGYGIYQQQQEDYGYKLYLRAGSPTTQLGGQVHAAGPLAQALRTAGPSTPWAASGLTATLVTAGYWGSAPTTLTLSISDEGDGVCP